MIASLNKYLNKLPPKKARQQFVYWGAIGLSLLLIVITSYYLQAIQSKLEQSAKQNLPQTAAIQSLVNINGRIITLRGEVEPNTLSEQQIAALKSLPGIRAVNNNLVEIPKRSAEVHLSHQNNRINLSGKLTGDDLDQIIYAVRKAYPYATIRDTIQIDDDLGHPLWLDQAAMLLPLLNTLDQFTFSGWRDAILINGTADTIAAATDLKYTLPIYLPPSIHLDYQVKVIPPNNAATVSLISGWNGAALHASIENQAMSEQLTQSLNALNTAESTPTNFQINPAHNNLNQLDQITTLIPALHKVHDLRLETSGEGYILWGRVDDPDHLGNIMKAINTTHLSNHIDNQIFIDPATKQPEISLFRDYQRIVLNGVLPSPSARTAIKSALTKRLDIEQIDDYTRIEPNIAHSPWLEEWHTLLPLMPENIFGLTIAEGKIFLSGEVQSQDALQSLNQTVNNLFNKQSQLNWLTVNNNASSN